VRLILTSVACRERCGDTLLDSAVRPAAAVSAAMKAVSCWALSAPAKNLSLSRKRLGRRSVGTMPKCVLQGTKKSESQVAGVAEEQASGQLVYR
jgi:hypothetical protein